MATSAVTMVRREGADGITVTAEHKALLDDVALEQGRKAIVARAASNYRQHTAWLATFATFVAEDRHQHVVAPALPVAEGSHRGSSSASWCASALPEHASGWP